MLNYFSYTNGIELEELTPVSVRKKLGVKNQEFKNLVERETSDLIKMYDFAKSDKILDVLVFLSVLRVTYTSIL